MSWLVCSSMVCQVNEGGDIDCWKGGVAPLSVTCKKEAPRNDGDTGVAFPAGPGARGDPAESTTLGTRWVRRPVGATGLIDGCHVALGPGGDLTCDGSWWAASAAGGVSIQPMSDHG
ncbi:hypothetical protein TIFTF001_023264 [Ficus carica]|uniref:Uncharacterized protein n=1 Tax=Ficus carica TaxID=3494 RepID=A0AA88ALG9_FICCA|nr:hypothetical protein TIFTF001_023264 [Ficus carica]